MTFSSRFGTTLVALLALSGAASLKAQDAHFGVQAGLNFNMGGSSNVNGNTDLSVSNKDAAGSTGFSVGLSVPIDFNGGHTIRPRIDYTRNSGTASDSLFGTGGIDGKVTSTFFGADYLYHFSQKNDGGYVLAGLGMANSKLTFSDNNGNSLDASKTAFAWSIGGGYQFTPMVGAELRYTSSHPSLNFGTGGSDFTLKNDALNLGVTFRF